MEIEEFKKILEDKDIQIESDISFLLEFTETLADKIIDDWSNKKVIE